MPVIKLRPKKATESTTPGALSPSSLPGHGHTSCACLRTPSMGTGVPPAPSSTSGPQTLRGPSWGMGIPTQPGLVMGICRSPVFSWQSSRDQDTRELICRLRSQSAGCQLQKGAVSILKHVPTALPSAPSAVWVLTFPGTQLGSGQSPR